MTFSDEERGLAFAKVSDSTRLQYPSDVAIELCCKLHRAVELLRTFVRDCEAVEGKPVVMNHVDDKVYEFLKECE